MTMRRIPVHLPNWQPSCSRSANPCGCAGRPRSNRAPQAAVAPAASSYNTPVFLYITPIILYATPIVLYANVRHCTLLYGVKYRNYLEDKKIAISEGRKQRVAAPSPSHRGLPVRRDATFISGPSFAARKSGRSRRWHGRGRCLTNAISVVWYDCSGWAARPARDGSLLQLLT